MCWSCPFTLRFKEDNGTTQKISWKIIFIMSKSMAASFSLWYTLIHLSFFCPAMPHTKELLSLPQTMCYSHYSNGVHFGAIFIVQWDLLSDWCKVNPIGQWGKILVIVMGFVDTFGHCVPTKPNKIKTFASLPKEK